GCLLSGFYLLRQFYVPTATYVAASINSMVAAAALGLSSESVSPTLPAVYDRRGSRSSISVYVAIAISGFCAMASEAIWTRLLGLLFGASVYTLTIIVAVFLVGLGIGSGIASLLCRNIARPRMALGW